MKAIEETASRAALRIAHALATFHTTHRCPHTNCLSPRPPPTPRSAGNCYGSGVTAADLRATADFFVSSGLAAVGYEFVSTDDGWMSGRDANGRMVADPVKFPGGMPALVAYVEGKGLKLGLYSAASSVVCSGRVGSLYNEDIDAETFAAWNIDYVKCAFPAPPPAQQRAPLSHAFHFHTASRQLWRVRPRQRAL